MICFLQHNLLLKGYDIPYRLDRNSNSGEYTFEVPESKV